MHKHETLSTQDSKTIISATCVDCGKTQQFEVATAHYDAWSNGALIQNALPEVPLEQREILISGMCSVCFDLLFDDDLETIEDEA